MAGFCACNGFDNMFCPVGLSSSRASFLFGTMISNRVTFLANMTDEAQTGPPLHQGAWLGSSLSHLHFAADYAGRTV
jgi:hypothetical protein